jgi:hypothetical protein
LPSETVLLQAFESGDEVSNWHNVSVETTALSEQCAVWPFLSLASLQSDFTGFLQATTYSCTKLPAHWRAVAEEVCHQRPFYCSVSVETTALSEQCAVWPFLSLASLQSDFPSLCGMEQKYYRIPPSHYL